MRRDPEFLKDLLIEMEESPKRIFFVPKYLSMSDEHLKKLYHTELCVDQGLVTQVSDAGYRLTSQGHDFIQAIKDKNRWSQIKDAIVNYGLPHAVEFGALLLKDAIKQQIGASG
ncbi:MAG: DUF2513 domain-containing protein [Planktomarina sp.]